MKMFINSIDENTQIAENYPTTLGEKKLDKTIIENLNYQIKFHQNALNELEEIKARLQTTGLLDCRINDLRIAMQY